MQPWTFLVVFQGHKLWFHLTSHSVPQGENKPISVPAASLHPTAWQQQVSGHTASQQLIAIETVSQQPVSSHLASQQLVTSPWTSQTPSCSYQSVSQEANREPAIPQKVHKDDRMKTEVRKSESLQQSGASSHGMFVQAEDREKDLHDLHPDRSLGTRMVPPICRRSRLTSRNKDICCQLKR